MGKILEYDDFMRHLENLPKDRILLDDCTKLRWVWHVEPTPGDIPTPHEYEEEVSWRKERMKKVAAYKTTDGKIFSGRNAKENANFRQERLDFRLKLDQFDVFLRDLFDIKARHIDKSDFTAAERNFCNKIMDEVSRYCAEEGDFKDEVSGFLLDLFSYIGPDKWIQIHEFLTRNTTLGRMNLHP